MLVGLVNQKGGTGKSTVAVHLAAAMLQKAPNTETVLIDCDPQRSSTRWAGEAVEGLRIENAQDPDELLDLLAELKDAGSSCVVDVAGTGSEAHRAAMLHCDLVVMPTGVGVLDLRALSDTARLLTQARKIRRDDLPKSVVVLNRYQGRLRLAGEAREAISSMGLETAQQTLGLRQAYADAAGQGLLVQNLAGAHDAANEMTALTEELLCL